MEKYATIMTSRGRRKVRPVTIGGIDYPSVKAAAAALGMSSPTLFHRLALGIDPLEPLQDSGRRRRVSWRKAHDLGHVAVVPRSGTFGRQAKPVIVDGRIYGSTSEAAAAIGTAVTYLQRCLKGGSCRGHQVRRAEEIDLILAEIEKRNRQPYQFTR